MQIFHHKGAKDIFFAVFVKEAKGHWFYYLSIQNIHIEVSVEMHFTPKTMQFVPNSSKES